jgi:hypothetical protein
MKCDRTVYKYLLMVRLVNVLKRIWKNLIVAQSRYYPSVIFEGLRTTAKTLIENR